MKGKSFVVYVGQIKYEWKQNKVEKCDFDGEHLTPGLYKMAGTAERENESPQTPPSEIQQRLAAILPE